MFQQGTAEQCYTVLLQATRERCGKDGNSPYYKFVPSKWFWSCYFKITKTTPCCFKTVRMSPPGLRLTDGSKPQLVVWGLVCSSGSIQTPRQESEGLLCLAAVPPCILTMQRRRRRWSRVRLGAVCLSSGCYLVRGEAQASLLTQPFVINGIQFIVSHFNSSNESGPSRRRCDGL